MKYISASDTKNSEYSGAEFLRLNNCGAFLGVQRPVVTKRPGGRADYQLIYIQSGALLVLQKAAARRFEAGTVLLFRPANRSATARTQPVPPTTGCILPAARRKRCSPLSKGFLSIRALFRKRRIFVSNAHAPLRRQSRITGCTATASCSRFSRFWRKS